MKIYLIRHGETKGNREHRYVGSSDEGLLPEGAKALADKRLPQVARVYASPLRRCLETAGLLFPGQEPIVIEDLKECDFGKFEYKSYEELNGDPDYQRFIDTVGESGFPGGEDMREFQRRCVRGFYEALQGEFERGKQQEAKKQPEVGKQPDIDKLPDGKNLPDPEGLPDIAFVVHGGTIMALLDQFSSPHRDYYDWQARNGSGYVTELTRGEDGTLFLTKIRSLAPETRTTAPDITKMLFDH